MRTKEGSHLTGIGFQNEYKPEMRRDFAVINCLALWIQYVLRLGMI